MKGHWIEILFGIIFLLSIYLIVSDALKPQKPTMMDCLRLPTDIGVVTCLKSIQGLKVANPV